MIKILVETDEDIINSQIQVDGESEDIMEELLITLRELISQMCAVDTDYSYESLVNYIYVNLLLRGEKDEA